MNYLQPFYWVFIILLFSPVEAHAQFSKNWSPWEVIYESEEGDLTVELKIYTPKPNSCVDKNKNFKFQYRVTGEYKRNPTYLNWKIAYIDCNDIRYYQQNSLPLWKRNYEDISGGVTIPAQDKQFTGREIYKKCYDKNTSSSKQEGYGLLPPLESTAPEYIKGPEKIYLGEIAELEVEGGELGEDAEWIWYVGGCGEIEKKKGKKIRLNIQRKTTVYVRAEGKNNRTKCIQKTVDVDLRSSDPNSASGDNDICRGEKTTLRVNGGTLGQDAQWVWYGGECGSNKIGTGPSISVQPDKTTRFFVRAEGKYNSTKCVNVLVTVHSPVEKPVKIDVAGSTSICQGESVTLKVSGSADGSSHKWYKGSCGSNFVGAGSNIEVRPYQTTTYFVRAEGTCNQTACLSRKISVSSSTSLPSNILVNNKGRKKTLSLSKNAQLASSAKWKWYKGTCGTGRSIANGTSIKIKDSKKPRTYFVRAEGGCSSTNCRSIYIEPLKNIKNKYQDFNNFHHGFSIGLEYHSIKDIKRYSSYNIDELNGLGLRGEIYFHPLLKNNYGIGVLSSISVGTSPYIFRGGDVRNSNPVQNDKYFYTAGNLGVEATLGFSPVKLIARVNKEVLRNKLDRRLGGNLVASFDEELNRDYFGLGLRLGTYKGGRLLDILYLMYRDNANDFLEFNDMFSQLDDRFTGFQISWRGFNKITLKSNIYIPATYQQMQRSNSNDDEVSVFLSVLINLDRFY